MKEHLLAVSVVMDVELGFISFHLKILRPLAVTVTPSSSYPRVRIPGVLRYSHADSTELATVTALEGSDSKLLHTYLHHSFATSKKISFSLMHPRYLQGFENGVKRKGMRWLRSTIADIWFPTPTHLLLITTFGSRVSLGRGRVYLLLKTHYLLQK